MGLQIFAYIIYSLVVLGMMKLFLSEIKKGDKFYMYLTSFGAAITAANGIFHFIVLLIGK